MIAVPVLIGLVGAGTLAIPPVRTRVLHDFGTMLVAQDPLAPADVIVIAPDVAEAGVLEAADLVHGRVATRVTVLAEPPSAIADEFTRRRVSYEDRSAQLIGLLHTLGVERAELLRLSVGSTEEVGRFLPEWCARQKLQSIVLVTGADHSRRLRRVVHRNMNGSPTQVILRVSRYSAFTADRWWQDRGTLRTGIVELQKLLLDVARHPLS
jgi:hypothetical protein